MANSANFKENCKLGKTQADITWRLLITQTILLIAGLKKKKNSACACVRECILPGDQKRASDPPDLELQAAMDLVTLPPCNKGSQPLSIFRAPQQDLLTYL